MITSSADRARYRWSCGIAAKARALLVLMICSVLIVSPLPAATGVSPRIDSAIARGLEYLASKQDARGSFEQRGPRLAVSALCILSFLASGHVPGDGRYGQTVQRGLDNLLESFPEDGYIGKVDGSRMYGQGIITLTLAEAYGVERDPARRKKIHDALVRAVSVIVKSQQVSKSEQHAGGWRYEPGSIDSDLSLSGWNALALRSCNNVGISVDRQCIDRAAEYVLRCYKKDKQGFCYQPWGAPSPAMTGVGVLNLYLMDRGEAPEVAAATNYLATANLSDTMRFPYYSFYYVTHAAFQSGDPLWSRVWKISSEHLLSRQTDDGSWPASRMAEEPGKIYATAMALLTLSVPNALLPVHQR